MIDFKQYRRMCVRRFIRSAQMHCAAVLTGRKSDFRTRLLSKHFKILLFMLSGNFITRYRRGNAGAHAHNAGAQAQAQQKAAIDATVITDDLGV